MRSSSYYRYFICTLSVLLILRFVQERFTPEVVRERPQEIGVECREATDVGSYQESTEFSAL
ncbi:hypothetical protein GPEL0_01f2691 [Geoanaerobacter pelophilus]|uniref:Uncharacterized protein n=1 Tax=Geoanaerobacter pelophilus TaxID=60036 RepID=A0ABQ0MJ15_9BACT|nr:hypothetical protein GPEL0_01f2691 [Geoanaerobacter pelophilus]